jgi:hypothetical protein
MSQISLPARFARFSSFARLLAFTAFPVGGLVAVGCFTGADLHEPERFQQNTTGYEHAGCFEAIVYNSCSGGICHTGEPGEGPPGGGIDLSAVGYAARLYNQPAQYPGVTASATCPPATAEKLIDPAGVESSLLWKKLTNTQACGDAMPGDPLLPQTDLDCVKALMQEIIADPPAPGGGSGGSGSGGGSGAVGGATSGGSPATGGMASGGAPACDIPKILSLNCSATTCHGTATKPPTSSDLDLITAGIEGRIYNKPATYKGVDVSTAANPAACPSPAQLLLDPAGLETSLMWMKVAKTHSCGDEMPNGLTFDATETGCYKAWLEGIITSPPK